MIYLDYAATGPADQEVLDLFHHINSKYFGNPNSPHKLGREAKKIIDDATENIAGILHVNKSEIIYTSGATESNNLAIKGIAAKYKNKGRHIIATDLEHSSVLAPLQTLVEQGYELDTVEILANGLVDIQHLKSLLRNDTILVSISYVDGEMGIKQQIDEIAALLQSYPKCLFHSDATQAIGKIPVDLTKIDLISIAPHKFHGLNGFGVLIKKDHVKLEPLINGGKSTTIYRSGTPVTALAACTALALEKSYKNMESHLSQVTELNHRIRTALSQYKDISINSTENAIPYILNLSVKGMKSTALAEELDQNDMYVSTKSACCPTNTMSRAVYALTKDKKAALSSLRISLSHLTTEEEIDEFLICFRACYEKLKK